MLFRRVKRSHRRAPNLLDAIEVIGILNQHLTVKFIALGARSLHED